MDTGDISTSWNSVYSLWHIPSSTLLVTTLLRDEVVRRVRSALFNGWKMEELMLQVTGENELIGCQHLGTSIVEALHLDEESGAAHADIT
jgi:hypothetical protein